MDVFGEQYDFGDFYSDVTDGGFNPPYQRVLSDLGMEPGAGLVAGVKGSETSNYLTGICLHSSRASDKVREGVNPVTGEEFEDYSNVREYLQAGPDSLGVIVDQFKLMDREGDLYVVIEDYEWPKKFGSQLEEAGIEFDPEVLDQDVAETYQRYLEMFETYVKDILGNDLLIHPLRTSENMDLIEEGMEEVEADPDKPLDRVFYIGSQLFPRYLEQEFGLDEEITKVDPLRHFPDLYKRGEATKGNHPLQDLRFQYYRDNSDPGVPLLLTYQALDPLNTGSNRQKEVESETPVNLSNLETIVDEMPDNPTNPFSSPAGRIATAFPNRMPEILNLREAEKEFSKRKEEFRDEALEKGLEGREIGEFFTEKRSELRQEHGEQADAYEELVEALVTDLQKIFGTEVRI